MCLIPIFTLSLSLPDPYVGLIPKLDLSLTWPSIGGHPARGIGWAHRPLPPFCTGDSHIEAALKERFIDLLQRAVAASMQEYQAYKTR